MKRLLLGLLFGFSLTVPALAACLDNITTFGAVGNGTTDNTTAINNALSDAHANGCSVEVPSGTFAHSNLLVANGVPIFGLGSASILKATTPATSAVEMTGSGGSITNLVILGVGSSRLTTFQSAGIWINGASHYSITNVLINGGACVGIFNDDASNGVVENNTVENTLADSITQTVGTNAVTVANNLVINSGDDGISNNSYVSDGALTVNHITITGNTVLGNAGGRGIEVSGGNNITYTGNYVDNKDGFADLYIATESEFNTQSVSAITATANAFIDGGPNQGSAIVYNSQGSGQTITTVTLNGNQFYNSALNAVQFAGNGAMSGVVQNSAAYTSIFPFYQNGSTGTFGFTFSNNTLSTPGAYPGPIATPTSGTQPVVSLATGTYALPQTLTLSNPTSGSSTEYCATTGTSCTPNLSYTSAITISIPETICANSVNNSSLIPVTSGTVCSSYTAAAGCQLSSGATVSQIQTALNSAGANSCPGAGSTVSFGAGSYTITSGMRLPCGVTVTAAVPTTPSNVVLSASFPEESTDIFTLNGGCTSATTLSYLSTLHAGLIVVSSPNSNLTISHNQVGDLKCCNSQLYSPAIYFTDPGSGNSNFINNATITYNQLGDSTSCTTPGGSDSSFSGNWMNDTESPEAPQMGECAGMVIQTSVNGVIFEYNNILHVEEGVHLLCYGDRCSPGDPGGSGPVTYNVTAQYNDFNQIHRIVWEEQPEAITAVTYQYNSEHDWYDSYFGSFGISMACCANPASFAPYLNTSSNLIVFNTVGASRYGYGIEAFGTGPPRFTNNLIQSPHPSSVAITYGYNSSGIAPNFNYNTLCGAGFANAGYIGQEFPGLTAPTTTGTVETSTCSVPQSATPTISPNSGSQSFPLTITLTDAGFGPTTPLPNGNTGIWYTTDGTTPVPGSGSAKYLSTGQTFVLTGPATVQAVGMWGAQNQPTSYTSGFGFVHSAVVSAVYTSGGGAPTLSSATIAPTGGASTLQVGGTVQMIVTCNYSDGSTSGCNTTDSHGNAVTSWASNSGNATVSSSGLATGAAVGTATITATVTGGITASPGAVLTVSASPLTLSSISLATAGGVSSITAGVTNQLLTTCHYNDGTSTSCNTMDSHGNAVTAANSSAPTIATVTSPGGLVTGVAAGSTNLSASVIPAPSMLGTNVENVTGATGLNFINEIYGVTGTSPGSYTPGNCHIIIPATTNWVAGKIWTCLLVQGTPTTQNASALCSNSYTMTGTSWPGGDIVISMAGCPALPPDQGYWVGSTTNQSQASPVQGFSNCGSSCSGASPTGGSGSYAYRYVANAFGSYTSLPTTLSASGTPGQQVSQYIELTTTPVNSPNLPLMVNAAPPTLQTAYITGTSSLVVPNTAQMAAKCHYSSGPDQDCTVADINGDAVSAWLTSDATKATVGNAGSAHPGLVTAVAAGTPSITAVINNAMNSTAFPITVTSPVVTLTGVSLSLTGGVTGLFVGATNQLKATCTYSDGSHDDCTTSDVHGNLAHNYASTTPAHATVNTASGLVTGVAVGATTFTAVAGSFTSNALPLNVFPVLSGVYTITVSGPVKFSGTVQF
jgi:hypothetical protein